MKKLILSMVIMTITMFTITGFAYDPPARPANGGYVVDTSGKLTPDDISRLNHRIETLNKNTKNEYGILLLQDMGGESIEDVAHATFNSWGVGKKDLDNGVLIVVAVKERKSRIETGKGVGGELPDITAKKILTENLNPKLKAGDFYGAFAATLDATSSQLESRTSTETGARPPKSCQASMSDPVTSSLLWGGAIILMFLVVMVVRRRAKAHAKALKEEAQRQADLDEQIEEARKAKEKREALKYAEAAAARAEKEKEVREAIARLKDDAKFFQDNLTQSFVPAPVPKPVAPKAPAKPKPVQSTMARPAVTTPPKPKAVPKADANAILAGASAAAATVAANTLRMQREEAVQRARAEEERAAQRRRQEDEDRRRRDREDAERRRRQEDDDRRSLASSISSISSLFDSGSSSSGSDSGSGFGGGDSGGGGSSSDW